jgi:putative endonuclease
MESNMSWNQDQGLAGEQLARQFLEKKGYKILAQRYRTRYGEIDLVATKKNALFFVEVKYRNHGHFGDPLQAITPRKVRHLIRAAHSYLQENPLLKDHLLHLAAIAVREYEEDKIDKIEMVLLKP